MLTEDPTKYEVARGCTYVWSEAMECNAQSLVKVFPDEEERTAFAEAVKEDVKNPAHHLFANMYVILRHYSLTIRYVVTGRKPGIDDAKRRR